MLETYGVGNGPSKNEELLRVIENAVNRGTVIVSCTQNQHGRVTQSSYDAGSAFGEAGVVSGSDMTIEAALAKLQYLFTEFADIEQIRDLIEVDMVGELTEKD